VDLAIPEHAVRRGHVGDRIGVKEQLVVRCPLPRVSLKSKTVCNRPTVFASVRRRLSLSQIHTTSVSGVWSLRKSGPKDIDTTSQLPTTLKDGLKLSTILLFVHQLEDILLPLDLVSPDLNDE